MRAFDPNNIPAIVNAIEQVLGSGHPISRTVQAAAIDPDLARNAWNAIENLPENQRRAIAGILSGTMMPGFKRSRKANVATITVAAISSAEAVATLKASKVCFQFPPFKVDVHNIRIMPTAPHLKPTFCKTNI